jgi:hypothetical protein
MKSLNPIDLGKKHLIEDCQKIKISDFLKSYRTKLKQLFLSYELEIAGLNIDLMTSKTGCNGLRFWFRCPNCKKRVGVLFRHPIGNKIGCRLCLNLEYRKRRYKGMVENKVCL